MRYGIFSDVHSNFEALEVILEAFRREDIDRYICAGDVVGYGANPNECIQKVMELRPLIVGGNHDFACAELIDTENFNDDAKVAVEWTKGVLGVSEREFLKSLGPVYEDGVITIVHATLDEPLKFNYIFTASETKTTFGVLKTPVCFCGHTHVPTIFTDEEGYISILNERNAQFIPGSRQVINVGSVGQPRDRDPRASYGIYDEGTKTLTISRAAYDIEKTLRKILDAGLPEFLAYRLLAGK
jgi:diadenosine tetraphosphatase ApaH/serine/threonine PP2A family protein phosphatase